MITKHNDLKDIIDSIRPPELKREAPDLTGIFKRIEKANFDVAKKSNCRIINTEDGKLLQLPVLGFSEGDLKVYEDSTGLVVEGTEPKNDLDIVQLGFDTSDFKKTFIIDNFVVSEIELKDGLLNITLAKKESDREYYGIKTK